MKKQAHNPRYDAGIEIMQNLRDNKSRRFAASYAPVYEGLISPIEDDSTVTPTRYDDEGDVIPETNETGFLLSLGEFLIGDYHHASERFKEASIADSWRLFHEKRLQAKTTNKLNYVAEALSKLDELNAAENYANLVDEYKYLCLEYANSAKSNNSVLVQNIKQKLEKCINDIVGFQTGMKFRGKSSDINIDLFFDPNKLWNTTNNTQNIDGRRLVLLENVTWDKREPVGIQALLSWALNLVEGGAMAIEKLLSPESSKNSYTKKAIKQSLPRDRWTDLMFEGYDEEGGPSTADLRKKIQPYKTYWERELEKRKIDAIQTSILYKNGNFLFDPQKINPKFRYYSEHNDSGLLGGLLPDQILYSFSELGSSWSDWENMALMTMSDVAAGYGAKALANIAVKRNPYINALLVVDEYTKLRAAGKVKLAARIAKLAEEAQKIINGTSFATSSIDALGKGTAMLSSAYFINRMREHETNSEVIDAWSSRVLQNSMNKNADLLKVLEITRRYLTSIGIPNENMTDIDLIQHAISYDIPTGDSVFEQEKKEAKKGLNKVYNDNMSLAVKDYVQAIPFLSFLGSALKSFANKAIDKFRDLTYNSFARGILDNAIERSAKHVFSNNNIFPKLQSKHVSDFLYKRLKLAGWVSTLEGIEEGLQHLLQQRYNRGEYDSYDTPKSQFLMSSIFPNFNIATDSAGAYLGILFGDPDNGVPELRRAMQIGAVSGFLGGSISFGAMSNILPLEGADNFRNLVGQLRTDAVINKIVGDSYGTAQDTQHMNMFYDALQKHGVTRLRLQQSLLDLKNFKGENVTDAYIDRDIELMNDVWYYSNNSKFNNTLKLRNIDKNSDQYKIEVVNAARRRAQLREQYRTIQNQMKEQDDIKYSILRKIFNTTDGLSEAQDPEIDSLVELLYKAYGEYKYSRKQKRAQLEESLRDLLKREAVQDWQLKKAEQDLLEFDNSLELNWHDYLEETIDKIIAYRNVENAEKLLYDITTKSDVINLISSELGLDIDSSKIQPYLDALLRQRDELYKLLEDDAVFNQNELRKQLNAARKKGLPILPLIENVARRVEKKFGIIPNQDDVDNIQQRLLISRAYYDVLKPVVDLYNTGEIDPRFAYKLASMPSWKALSKEEQKLFLDTVNEQRVKDGKSPLTQKGIIFEYVKQQKLAVGKIKDLSDRYTKHMHDHTSQEDSGSVDIDAESMRREAALAFMDFEYNKFEDIRRINHREYLRDLSTVLLENEAAAGDNDAKRVLSEQIELYSNEQDLVEPQPTVTRSDQDDKNTLQEKASSEELSTILDRSQDSSEELTKPADELLQNVIDASSDESGPIDKPSDESRYQPVMTSLERSLRLRLGLDDEEPSYMHKPSQDEQSYVDTHSDESTSPEELQALNEIDAFGESTFDTFLQTRNERTVLSNDQIYSDFLHLTFRYKNNASENELPTIINRKIVRDKTGKPVLNQDGSIKYKDIPIKFKNGAQLRSGGILAKKLLIPGWFLNADKYFMITADESSVVDIKNPDNLVVILVIQDGNDAYCTFMAGLLTKLNREGGIMDEGEKNIRERMKTMFYSSFYTEDESGKLTKHIVKDNYGNIDNDEISIARAIIFKNQYRINHPEKNFTNVSEDQIWADAVKWYNKLDAKKKSEVDFLLRKFLSGNSEVFSDQKIEEEIQKLRSVRNLIIDACLSKDPDGNYIIPEDPTQYKNIKPLNPRTSGGKINEQKTKDGYKFRKLTDGGFGISNDLEELTKQITNEEVMLGVGLGERSFSYVPGKRAPVAKLDPDATGNYNAYGYGHSGKIYYIATTVNGDRRAVQLFEKKFKDEKEDIDARYVEEAFDEHGRIKDGETPTVAELILRLVTNTISNDVFSGIPVKYIPQFKLRLLEIIVNADKSTWVKANKEKEWQHLAKKQFFFDELSGDLIVALKDLNGDYRHSFFNITDIKTDENVRKIIIAAISNNLHWNTERRAMVDMLPFELLESLRQVFKNDDTLTEYKVAGIDDLTFKKSDFFNDDLSYKKVSLAAWMIHSGKLLTSVGETIFDSPFVYADGAMKDNDSGTIITEIGEKINKGNNKNDEQKTTSNQIYSRLNEFNAKRVQNFLYIQDKASRENLTNGKPIKDFALLNVDVGKDITEKSLEEITASLKESVKKYLQFLKKEYDVNVDESEVLYPEDSEYIAVQNGQALFTAAMNKNKKIIISVDSIDSIEQMCSVDQIPVSGVFSTVKLDGALDIDAARLWIHDTLGLKKSLVVVTNAILKAVDGKEVFGVTNVVVDTLDDVIKGVIMLRSDGSKGLQYHEAFHYVNLLLHTKQERLAIYDAYLKLHPEFAGTKNKLIEEYLADDFKQYCEDIEEWNNKQQRRNKLSRWLHSFMKSIVDFVKAWKKTDVITKLYKNIHSGNYKGRLIDEESLEEFVKLYPTGANFYIPGQKTDVKFDAIQDARTFFDVAENVAHSFLDFANVKRVGDISGINAKTFESFFEKLKKDNLRKDNPFIQDVINNPDAFIDTINSLLRRYGITRVNKTAHGNKLIVDDDKKEQQQPSNEIGQLSALYDNYTINKKDNVAFRAKLFLCLVKDSEFVYDKNTKQNVLRQKTDPVTGLPMYMLYDNVWLILVKELNTVDSYDDILKTVYRLSKTKAFFAELYKNLQSIQDDVELQTQIFNTVNKHLTKVAQIELSDPVKKYKKKLRYSDGTEASDDMTPSAVITKTFDQNKKIEILNDNALKAKKMLPRDWSKDLFASPLIEFVNGVYQINRDYAKTLQNDLKAIKQKMRMDDVLTSLEKEQISQQVIPDILSLLQRMAIPFDEDVLVEYIQMHILNKENRLKEQNDNENSENNVSSDDFYEAIKQILQDPLASKSNSANISFFINTVFNSRSTSILKVSRKKMKAINIQNYSSSRNLDEIYVGSAGEIEKMAIAYNNIYPSSRELSITGPGGNLIFPVGENNFMSDITRWINKNHDGIIKKLLDTKYAANSHVLEVARILVESNKLGKSFEFKLNVFAGMEDQQSKKGEDYFGINSLEDVLSKMIMMNRSIYGGENKGSDMIILPTMADKKTYYALELVSKNDEPTDIFNMPHDLLISEALSDEDIIFSKSQEYNGVRRFSDTTLERFALYFEDELNSLILYYDKDNIKNVVKNKQIRKKNFHGKVKNGKMDFSGNGGHFRYFYGLRYSFQYGEEISDLNLNQVLEWEYMKEKNAGDPVYGEGTWRYRKDSDELDGFEGVRDRLQHIKTYFLENRKVLYDAINEMIFKRIDDQMRKFADDGPNLLIRVLSYSDPLDPQSEVEVHYANRAIPVQLVNGYVQKFKNNGRWTGENGTGEFYSYSSFGNSKNAEDVMLTIIGNFVVQSMISTIEIEKVFAGDPAFYKWKYSRKKERKIIGDFAHDFEVLIEKDTDKIKRLGALLSPGSELRTDFSEQDYKKYPWLRGTKYINATVADVNARSIYVDEIKALFTKQMLADILRSANADNELLNKIYTDEAVFKEQYDSLTDFQKQNIERSVEQQVRPYTDITVSDALVLIRPHLYRKIRMMLGQWSVIPIKIKYKDYNGDTHETWYSDNEAYDIIENDPNWMIDPEKAAKVSRLLLFPLKMTYFKNDPRELNPGNNIAYGLYNKMAIFPAFKFLFRSTTGKLIYNRMNRESDPLDMLTFESAVKVGLNLNIYSPFDKETTSLSKLKNGFDERSGCVLDANDNENWLKEGGFVVEVQDLKGLRMLLNTEAHTDEERAIGTQMFKILFGNIYDEEDYVIGKDGKFTRKGKEIRDDIMACIKALTAIGAHRIKSRFYNEDGSTINKAAVAKYLNEIIENNNISNTVAEILAKGGTIESLMLRTLFEHSVSSLVNSHVIDINTKGGSAIQLSVFGFVSYDSNQIRTLQDSEDGMPVLNDGRELNWNEEDGSMEVMLSMNFFKSVVPLKYQRSYSLMRQWLINNDIIKGFKKEINPIFSKLDLLIDSPEYTSGPNLSVTTSAVFNELGIKTFGDIISKSKEISNRFAALGEKNLITEVESLLKIVGLSLDTKIPKDKYTFIEEKLEIIEVLDKRLDTFNLSPQLSVWLDKHGIKTMQDVIDNKSAFTLFDRSGKIRKEVESIMNDAYYLQFGINWNTKRPLPKYVMSKPKPFGVGYRIPTQGLSSTFAFTVADVLPAWCGDTIIVPREFTAQTGSDFDVDKLFLATMSYKNGLLESVDGDNLLNASAGAISNRLLLNYIDVVTDVKNRSNARASIDVVTGIIQDSTLPAIRGASTQYAPSMYELTPYFLLQRKQEFSIGKNGIGPFALNITNLSLTQYSHISMDFSNLPVKLGALDKIVGEDEIRISDWLSAMVNAHVDVAKDPYIFDLNVNGATYKFTNLLLRAGKGESTFLFLALPAIKKYAQMWNSSQGLYGNNLLYDDENKKVARSNIISSLLKTYLGDSDKKIPGLIYQKIQALTNEDEKRKYLQKLSNLKKGDTDLNIVFDVSYAKKMLRDKQSIDYLIFQAKCLTVLDALDPYAQELSDLVMVSRIDTKKFGNTIALQRDFINEYQKFKYGKRDVSWYNTDGNPMDARERYFSETFLEDKLYTATGLVRDILSTLSIVSSKLFGDMMNTIFIEIFNQSEEVSDSTGSKLNVYDKVYNKDAVLQISNAAENIIRHRLLSFYARDVNSIVFKEKEDLTDSAKSWKDIEKENNYFGPIDFTFGGDSEVMVHELERLWFGNPLSEDPYERYSIFTNMAKVINKLETSSIEDRVGRFNQLVDKNGRVINALLNYLKPQPANNKFSIPRLLLRKTNRNTFSDEKNRLISAFYDILTNDSATMRRFGRDLALYAYFSTYNTNEANAFFDLVPYEFRKQYDLAIAEGVDKQNSTAIFAVQDAENIDYSVECRHMLDAICRNFYMNDDIVPLYEYSGKYKSKYAGRGSGEIIKNIPGSKVPMYILTTELDKPYVKININGEYILYKKRMRIFAEASTGSIYGKDWNLYLPEEKLGVHEGTTHQYELHATSKDGSIFEDNAIPAGWSRKPVAESVLRFIRESLEKIDKNLAKRKKVRTVEYVTVKYQNVGRLDIQTSLDISVHKTIDQLIKSSKNIVVENVNTYILDNSNVIIDVSKPSYQDDISILQENNQYSAEKDGVSIGIVGKPDTQSENEQTLRENYKSEIYKIFAQIENQALNVSTMYVEDTLFGNTVADVYTQSGFSFADEISIVSLKKVDVDKAVIEKPLDSIDKPSKDVIDDAKHLDNYVGKTLLFLDEPISTGRVQAVTKEMLKKLREFQLKQLNKITSESSKLNNLGDSYSGRC